MKDIIIIGNGPAGLTAAIYAKRAGRDVLLLSDSPIGGGQIATTYEVDNYPGLPGVGGMDLGQKMAEHAKSLGCEVQLGRVSEIRHDRPTNAPPAAETKTTDATHNTDKSTATKETETTDDSKTAESPFTVVSDKGEWKSRTVVIATGATHSRLGVPGEETLSGLGVSYCATCDGAFFKKKTVAVVGGGDVALEDAIYLSRFTQKVLLIHRRDKYRGAKVLQDMVISLDNIEPIYDSVVEEIIGDGVVEEVRIHNLRTDTSEIRPVNGVFIAVGTRPNLDGIGGLPARDEAGYIIAGENTETSIPGLFAAGDVRTKPLRQVATAVADGANAAFAADSFLNRSITI